MKTTLHLGLDVHKDSITIAIAQGGRSGEVRLHGTITNDLHAVEKLIIQLRKAHPGTALEACYEAGPCGFGIARRLQQLKIPCTVVAPSLIPSRSGDRVKTDKRDAVRLARLHRAGELSAIYVPEATDEAIRDLCRARTDGSPTHQPPYSPPPPRPWMISAAAGIGSRLFSCAMVIVIRARAGGL